MFYRIRDSNSPMIFLVGAFIFAIVCLVIRYWNALAR